MQNAEFEKLATSSIDEHYLRRAFTSFPSYWNGFVTAVESLNGLLTDPQFEALLKNKLQLGLSQFDEKQYVQIACETTITTYFARKFKTAFPMRPKPIQKLKKTLIARIPIRNIRERGTPLNIIQLT